MTASSVLTARAPWLYLPWRWPTTAPAPSPDPPGPTLYCLGFAFTPDGERVVLIKKNKGWQIGFLNGLGGHVEKHEDPREAVAREFLEESGVHIPSRDWNAFGALYGPGYEVSLFTARHSQVPDVRTTTDEEVLLYSRRLAQSGDLHALTDTPWLVALAWDYYQAPSFTEVEYES
jgi:8-oxo-dGTP diphosphatase